MFGGFSPLSAAMMFLAHMVAIIVLVFLLALPMWGTSTVFESFNNALSFEIGSSLNTSSPAAPSGRGSERSGGLRAGPHDARPKGIHSAGRLTGAGPPGPDTSDRSGSRARPGDAAHRASRFRPDIATGT